MIFLTKIIICLFKKHNSIQKLQKVLIQGEMIQVCVMDDTHLSNLASPVAMNEKKEIIQGTS